MTKTIIADSSPLIVLLKSDLEDILPGLFDEILVPEAVWQEILAGGERDAAQRIVAFGCVNRNAVRNCLRTLKLRRRREKKVARRETSG